MKVIFSSYKFLGICSIVAIACFLFFQSVFPSVLDGGENAKDPFKKMKPWEAASFKWSYPDEVWDAFEADESLELVRKHFEDMEADGVPRYIGGDWRMEGPLNIGGRLNTIAVDPFNEDRIFAGSCAGGLFITEDGGETW